MARERYERQQARRAAAASRRRRGQVLATVAVAVLALVAGVVGLAVLGGDDNGTVRAEGPRKSGTPTASESPSQSPSPDASTPGAGCTYTKSGEAAKDVGLPEYDADKPDQYRKPFAATLATDQGEIVITMAADKAPCTTNSFRHLASEGYFDDTSCHRLTTQNIFVLQCGDPTGTGSGGPGYQFGEENVPGEQENNYPAGSVAMANAGPGTNGSQFFLVYQDTTLPAGYTIFGTVTKGLEVVRTVAEAGVEGGGGDGAPAQPVTIQSVQVGKP